MNIISVHKKDKLISNLMKENKEDIITLFNQYLKNRNLKKMRELLVKHSSKIDESFKEFFNRVCDWRP